MPSSSKTPTLTELKSRAQLLDATVRVGKAGVDPAFYVELNRCLDARHLVKIKFMAFKDERKSLAPAIASGHLESLWVYLTAPFVGAGLAVVTHQLLYPKS